MNRILEFSPAWDRRDPDPKKNYGLHGVSMRWLLKGKLGTVQFLLYTNWQLPTVAKEFEFQKVPSCLTAPMPADLGYHSRVPLYDSQRPMEEKTIEGTKKVKMPDGEELEFPNIVPQNKFIPCEYLDGDVCFYDGSSLNAQKPFEILVTSGEEALWNYLQIYYEDTLGEEHKFWKHLNIFYTTSLVNNLLGERTWFYLYRHPRGFWEKSKEYNSVYKVLFYKTIQQIKILYRKLCIQLATWLSTRKEL